MYIKKHLREGLKFLGPNYCIKTIDWEKCLYRDLGDYDIEISHETRNKGYIIYLWSKRKYLHIIRTYPKTNNLSELKRYLDEIEINYTKKSN